MLGKLKNWFSKKAARPSSPEPPPPFKTGAHATPRPRPGSTRDPKPESKTDETYSELSGHIETIGPGKNVLVRNRLLREDSGTHETLKVVDDSPVDSGEEQGIDPYNTGGFDRSKNWDKRFGK